MDEYVSLERVRFEDRLRFERKLEPLALSARVPPMLVHTLVENAVKHGIAQAPAGGIVRVEATVHANRVTISVTNTVHSEPASTSKATGFATRLSG